MENIQKTMEYLSNILKEANHKLTEVKYDWLKKGYWIVGENDDWYLGNNKENSEQYLRDYLKNVSKGE